MVFSPVIFIYLSLPSPEKDITTREVHFSRWQGTTLHDLLMKRKFCKRKLNSISLLSLLARKAKQQQKKFLSNQQEIHLNIFLFSSLSFYPVRIYHHIPATGKTFSECTIHLFKETYSLSVFPLKLTQILNSVLLSSHFGHILVSLIT